MLAMSKKNIITFADYSGTIPEEYYPKPAKSFIPNWYKEANSFVGNKKVPVAREQDGGETASTIKKCMPVFDSLTAGYIIPLPNDVGITIEDGISVFRVPPARPFIDKHSEKQTQNHPDIKNPKQPSPKFVNTWVIKTPPGYSCLFVTPFHRDNLFKLFEAIVDTDTYNGAIEFPFELKEVGWEGIIPAGSPMVQIIPFKRESWNYEISDSNEDRGLQEKFYRSVRSVFFEAYKTKFWQKKEFN